MAYEFTHDMFVEALGTFVEGCFRISNDYREKHFPNLPTVTFETVVGQRYVRVVVGDANGGQRSVHCFVDQLNGDVLKAASWKAPAKHARGNVFDGQKGLGSMGPYGPAYLR